MSAGWNSASGTHRRDAVARGAGARGRSALAAEEGKLGARQFGLGQVARCEYQSAARYCRLRSGSGHLGDWQWPRCELTRVLLDEAAPVTRSAQNSYENLCGSVAQTDTDKIRWG
jgi:hypothetical protein